MHHLDNEVFHIATDLIIAERRGEPRRLPLDEKTKDSTISWLVVMDQARLKQYDLAFPTVINRAIKDVSLVASKFLRTRGDRALSVLQSLNSMIVKQPLSIGMIEPLKIAMSPSTVNVFRPADAMIALGALVDHERILELYFGPLVRKSLKNASSAIPVLADRLQDLESFERHAWWQLLKQNGKAQDDSEPTDPATPPLSVKTSMLNDAKALYEKLGSVRSFIKDSEQQFKRIFAASATGQKDLVKISMVRASREMDGTPTFYKDMEDDEAEMNKFKNDTLINMINGGLPQLLLWERKSEMLTAIQRTIFAKGSECSLLDAFDGAFPSYIVDGGTFLQNETIFTILECYRSGVDVMKDLGDREDPDGSTEQIKQLRIVLRLLMCSTLSEKELILLSRDYLPATSPASPRGSSSSKSRSNAADQELFLSKSRHIIFAKTLRAALIEWSKELGEKCKQLMQVDKGVSAVLLKEAIDVWKLVPQKTSRYTGSVIEYKAAKDRIAKVLAKEESDAVPFSIDGNEEATKRLEDACKSAVRDVLFVEPDADTEVEEGFQAEEEDDDDDDVDLDNGDKKKKRKTSMNEDSESQDRNVQPPKAKRSRNNGMTQAALTQAIGEVDDDDDEGEGGIDIESESATQRVGEVLPSKGGSKPKKNKASKIGATVTFDDQTEIEPLVTFSDVEEDYNPYDREPVMPDLSNDPEALSLIKRALDSVRYPSSSRMQPEGDDDEDLTKQPQKRSLKPTSQLGRRRDNDDDMSGLNDYEIDMIQEERAKEERRIAREERKRLEHEARLRTVSAFARDDDGDGDTDRSSSHGASTGTTAAFPPPPPPSHLSGVMRSPERRVFVEENQLAAQRVKDRANQAVRDENEDDEDDGDRLLRGGGRGGGGGAAAAGGGGGGRRQALPPPAYEEDEAGRSGGGGGGVGSGGGGFTYKPPRGRLIFSEVENQAIMDGYEEYHERIRNGQSVKMSTGGKVWAWIKALSAKRHLIDPSRTNVDLKDKYKTLFNQGKVKPHVAAERKRGRYEDDDVRYPAPLTDAAADAHGGGGGGGHEQAAPVVHLDENRVKDLVLDAIDHLMEDKPGKPAMAATLSSITKRIDPTPPQEMIKAAIETLVRDEKIVFKGDDQGYVRT